MRAEVSVREGNLAAALEELQQQVRDHPADPKLRVFLFQLLAVLGQWNRALTQLNVAGELDDGTLAMVQTYREALRCEVLRQEVFAGGRSPLVFGDPQQWIALLIQALRLVADGQFAGARQLRDEAFDAAPTVPGTINGDAFQWLADGDSRLGPVLEAVINGGYYWVPFDCIAQIDIDEPEDLRDLVWMPARFRWANGGECVGLVPTRYAGSAAQEDDGLRMARRTEWQEHEGDTWLGLGQRMLATDTGEYPLMEARRIVFAGDEAAGG